MSNSTLTAQQIQQIKSFSAFSDSFRSEVVGLLENQVTKAKALISQLSKMAAGDTAESVEKPAPKKRGRPKGSVNKGPSKPRAKKTAVTEPSATTTEVAHTHGSSILSVLTKDGLGASEIWDAIVAANIPGYKVPEKKVLYTTLSSMKSKGALKTKGDRPNVKYLKP